MKHYIEFYFPGSFISETTEKEINNRDDNFEIPKYAYGYKFYDKNESGIINKTGTYFLRGKISTKEEVELLNIDNKYDIALINMEYNNIDKVVISKYGQIFPFNKGDVSLEKNYMRKIKLKKILK